MFGRLETYLEMLKADPVNFLIYMVYTWGVILISLILHECAHGWMALRCGDPTAKMMGRLSLNPARHLDPIGTICMFVFGFGWAKPVPVNPRNFQNYRRDDFLVSIAGVVTNLTIFIICCLLAVVINTAIWNPDFMPLFEYAYGRSDPEFMVNIFAPAESDYVAAYIAYGFSFDWIKAFTSNYWLLYVQRFLLLMADVNLTLALFNLLPIPPLDGYHVVNDTLLKGRFNLNMQAFNIARIALIFLLLTGILDTFLIKGGELVGGAVIRTFLQLTGQM